MGRIYAVREDDGKRVLVEISCDLCGKTIKPNPDIAQSGWLKYGCMGSEEFDRYLCPDCIGKESRR